MICNTVPEEEQQNHEEKRVRVGRPSEGVSCVPACPRWLCWKQIVNTEPEGGRANAPELWL